MTRAAALADLALAEAELAAARRDIEIAAEPGYIERPRAMELAARLESANAKIHHLRSELRKLADR